MPRKKYERLLEWEREAIAQAYLDGEKLLSIAEEFNVLESTVSRIAERRGYERRTWRGPLSGKHAKTTPPKKSFYWKTKRGLWMQRQRNIELRAAQKKSGGL